MHTVGGAAADVLEQIQTEYEDAPGFVGVVYDGARPIIVVDRDRIHEWEAAEGPLGIAVAPSCVGQELLDSIKAVLPGLARASGVTVIAGYDALVDAIMVRGVDVHQLIDALATVLPNAELVAHDAIAAGTLRVHPWNGVFTDAFPPLVPKPEPSQSTN